MTRPASPDPARRPGRLGVGVVGAGRVGAVLGAALRAAGHAVVGVHAVSEASRDRAEALLPGVPVLQIPQILERSELVLFAVPDDALAPLVEGLAAAGHVQSGHILVHVSGSHGTEVFAPARERGAIGLAIHPAMTFTGLSLDLSRLSSCAFGVTAPAPFLPIAQALVVEMGGEPVVLRDGDRPLYHAALSHASNHLVTLVAQAEQVLGIIGVEDPGRLLSPLLRASLDNALASGDSALTGPVARGDSGTVRAHREILDSYGREEGAEDVGRAWLALARATAERAARRGALAPERLRAVLEALDGTSEPDSDSPDADSGSGPGTATESSPAERPGDEGSAGRQ